MLKTTERKQDAIERSYQLLALLDVCELAASQIRDQPAAATRHAGSLANVITLAGEIAGEVHDVLETKLK